MAQTGSLSDAELAEIAHTRATDGNSAGGLERVVRMAQAAAVTHSALSLAEIRPDLADEDPEMDAAQRRAVKGRLLAALIRNSGPVHRLSRVGIVKRRIDLGLS